MELKDYQNIAIKDLYNKGKTLLTEEGSRKIIFQSPTGSGKTVMMSEVIFRLSEDSNLDESLCFIWVAPNNLHIQSKTKIQQYLSDKSLNTLSMFNELQNNLIKENEILFINWPSINKTTKNTIVKENEQEFYLEKIIQNTLNLERKIVLIIDESHDSASTSTSSGLIEIISPQLVYKVSATHKEIGNMDELVNVRVSQVKEEQIIRDQLIINDNFFTNKRLKIVNDLEQKLNEEIISQSLEKLDELELKYKNHNSSNKPLMLIQIPDKLNKAEEEPLFEEVVQMLEKKGISIENDNLSFYMSDKNQGKINLDSHNQPLPNVRVLIFKRAIALGWDCPRAQILTLFREHKEFTFSTQTVGRILRVSEPEIGYYSDPALNNAYIYTNLSNLNTVNEIADNFLVSATSYRKKSYENLNLKSYHRKRNRSITRIDPSFGKHFISSAKKLKISENLKINNNKVFENQISNKVIETIDEEQEIKGNKKIEIKNPEDLQFRFDNLIIEFLKPDFTDMSENRSVKNVASAIYNFFDKEIGISISDEVEEDNHIKIMKIFLDNKNQNLFENVMQKAKESYKTKIEKVEDELIKNDWEVPETINFIGDTKEVPSKKSIMAPYLIKSSSNQWKSEQNFFNYLEKNKNVKWFFKNGESDMTYFSVKYKDLNLNEKLFYVDWLVMFKNNKLAIIDTKQGETKKTSLQKHKGLTKYIKSIKNENVFGGIVTNTSNDYKGTWKLFIGSSQKQLEDESFNSWINLDEKINS